MKDTARRRLMQGARGRSDRSDPVGWLRDFDSPVARRFRSAVWGERTPNPHLMDWLETHPIDGSGWQAVMLGNGMAGDAEALSTHGYEVLALDNTADTVERCRQQYRESHVHYQVADLLRPHPAWRHRFDLAYASDTIRAYAGEERLRAFKAIADLVGPFGVVLVSCSGTMLGVNPDELQPSLERWELDGFLFAGLKEETVRAYVDEQDTPEPNFFASYRKPPYAQ